MRYNVIILAQGQQSRLPDIDRAKQLLPLIACDNIPILHRTLVLLSKLPWTDCMVTVVHDDRISLRPDRLHPAVRAALFRPGFYLEGACLENPGNSSLKGLARYAELDRHKSRLPVYDATVVLLGDVVYSWDCLRALFDVDPCNSDRLYSIVFAGSTHLGVGGGELWGCSWSNNIDTQMRQAMLRAMDKHPPAQVDKVYQPGQMRRLLFEIDDGYKWAPGRALAERWWFRPIDGYITDVDTPIDVTALADVSKDAARDDRNHDLVWT